MEGHKPNLTNSSVLCKGKTSWIVTYHVQNKFRIIWILCITLFYYIHSTCSKKAVYLFFIRNWILLEILGFFQWVFEQQKTNGYFIKKNKKCDIHGGNIQVIVISEFINPGVALGRRGKTGRCNSLVNVSDFRWHILRINAVE